MIIIIILFTHQSIFFLVSLEYPTRHTILSALTSRIQTKHLFLAGTVHTHAFKRLQSPEVPLTNPVPVLRRTLPFFMNYFIVHKHICKMAARYKICTNLLLDHVKEKNVGHWCLTRLY